MSKIYVFLRSTCDDVHCSSKPFCGRQFFFLLWGIPSKVPPNTTGVEGGDKELIGTRMRVVVHSECQTKASLVHPDPYPASPPPIRPHQSQYSLPTASQN
jgi:hypothetical protein